MTPSATIHDEYGEEETIVTKHASLVKQIARHVMSRLPSSVQMDDLVQSGLIGLMEAARLYDPSQGASFETYAKIRIRGAMIDELRRNDWTPRSLSKRIRKLSETTRSIENQKGRAAKNQEIADRLGLSLDEYHHLIVEANSHNFCSLDTMEHFDTPARDDDVDSTYESVELDRCRSFISKAISSLPEREQVVLSLYYERDMTLKEIGAVLGVSESRVCQIHGEATAALKARVRSWQ